MPSLRLKPTPAQLTALQHAYDQLQAALETRFYLTPQHYDQLRTTLREVLDGQPKFAPHYAAARDEHVLLQLVHDDNRVLNLPWRMAVPEREWLSLSCGTQPLASDADRRLFAPPLKILVMVAAPENSGGGRLDYETEEARIIEAFSPLLAGGRVQIDFTDDGSLDDLKRKLRQNRYHILHFSGHGTWDADGLTGYQLTGERQPNTGYLELENARTLRRELVTSEAFARALNDLPDHRPDLVVLSSCQTAQGQASEGGFRGVANQLAAKGAPAVVAMGFSVLDRAAIEFAARLYAELGEKRPLSQAFQRALAHLKQVEAPTAQQRGAVPSQWLIPQLYLRQPVERLVDWEAAQEAITYRSVKFATGEKRLLLKDRKGYQFVGRRRARRAATRQLQGEQKAVLLRGMGGVGKTALAEHLLGRMVAHDPRVVPFVVNESQYNTLEAVLRQLLDYAQFEMGELTIRYDLDDNDPPEKRLLQVLQKVATHGQPVFLFDNLESFQDGPGGAFRPEHDDIRVILQFLLKWGKLPLILTGRYPLREFPDLPTVDLNSVAYGDFYRKCLQLSFADLLEKERTVTRKSEGGAPERVSFQQLTELLHATLGGNYRALEFFDELYQQQRADIAATLADLEGFRRQLSEAHAPAVRDRLQSGARDLIFDQLYELLTPEAQRSLHLLAGFRVPVLATGLAMQDVAGEVASQLAELHRLSLVERSERPTELEPLVFWYVPPLVRDFVAEQETEAAFSHARAGKYFKYLAEEVTRLVSDAEEAFWHYLQAEAKAEVNEVGRRLCRIYYLKQLYAKSRFYGETTERLLGDGTHPTILSDLGMIFKIYGRLELALRYQQKVLAHMQAIGDREGEGATLNNISQIYRARGAYDQALPLLQQSLKIRQEIGDRQGEGVTLNNISQIYQARGAYDQALPLLQQSLKIRQETGDREGEGVTLNNMAGIAYARGAYDQALPLLQQSLKIRQEIGDREGEGVTLNNIGQIYKARGAYDQALPLLQQSLKIRQEIGDRQGEGAILNNIGHIYQARGAYDQALPLLQQSLKILQEIGDRQGEGTTLNNIGQIYQVRGAYDQALPLLQQSLKILQEIGDRQGEGQSLNNIGSIYQAQGAYDHALSFLRQSLKILQEIGDRQGEGITLHNMGTIVLEHQRQPEAAVPLFVQAYAILSKLGSPNVKHPKSYLEHIIQEIGEARYQEILAEMQREAGGAGE